MHLVPPADTLKQHCCLLRPGAVVLLAPGGGWSPKELLPGLVTDHFGGYTPTDERMEPTLDLEADLEMDCCEDLLPSDAAVPLLERRPNVCDDVCRSSQMWTSSR